MHSDNIFICRDLGERVGPITASIQFPTIYVAQTAEDIQTGDIIERDLPTGRTERMRVEDAEYLSQGGCSWKLNVIKLNADGEVPAKSNVQPGTLSITNSQYVQVGNGNSMSIRQMLESMIEASDSSSASLEDRNSFKKCVSNLIAHPLFTAIAGGVAGSVAGAATVAQG